MILSTFPSALQISSPCICADRNNTAVSSSESVISPLCPWIRKQTLGGSVLKHFQARQQNGRDSDSMLWKCRASGELEVDAVSSEVVSSKPKPGLASGSPVVVVEAPPMLKTAEPMPMMRQNNGLIKPGDAGRIIDRRPKDVWAVRFAVGAYLIDGKYFEALDEE